LGGTQIQKRAGIQAQRPRILPFKNGSSKDFTYEALLIVLIFLLLNDNI